MEEFIRNNIRNMVGEAGLRRADIVAARAAIIMEHDEAIDLASLVLGLWIGNEGEMPDTFEYGVVGLTGTLAQLKMVTIPKADMDR